MAAAAAGPRYGTIEYFESEFNCPDSILFRMDSALDSLCNNERVEKEAKLLKDTINPLLAPFKAFYDQPLHVRSYPLKQAELAGLEADLKKQTDKVNELRKRFFDLLEGAAVTKDEDQFGVSVLFEGRRERIFFLRETNLGCPKFVAYDCSLFLLINGEEVINLSKSRSLADRPRSFTVTFEKHNNNGPTASVNTYTIELLNQVFRKYGPKDRVYIDCREGYLLDRILVYKN